MHLAVLALIPLIAAPASGQAAQHCAAATNSAVATPIVSATLAQSRAGLTVDARFAQPIPLSGVVAIRLDVRGAPAVEWMLLPGPDVTIAGRTALLRADAVAVGRGDWTVTVEEWGSGGSAERQTCWPNI